MKWRVQQDAVDHNADPCKSRATERELALKIVLRGDARQSLDGAERIVGEHAGQITQLVSSKADRVRRFVRVWSRGDLDELAAGHRIRHQGHVDVGRALHVLGYRPVPYGSDAERTHLAAGFDTEAAIGGSVCRPCVFLAPDPDARQRFARSSVGDAPMNLS